LVKRATECITSAGAAQGAAGAIPEATTDKHSATYFPGIVPKLQMLLTSLIGVDLCKATSSAGNHVVVE
jgi:hypothetical protein